MPSTTPEERIPDSGLPSPAVTDMLGRLFGTILATLFEKQHRNLSDEQEHVTTMLSQVRAAFAGRPDIPSPPSPSPTKADALRHELTALKRTESDAIDLISRSSSFFTNQRDADFHVIPFRGRSVPEGIIAFLTKLARGNPHTKNVIAVLGDVCHEPYLVENVADLKTDTDYWSRNDIKQTLTYDFKAMTVAVTHYFLRSTGYGANTYHLRSWVIEASEDGTDDTWKEIDRREDDVSLNGPNADNAFEARAVIAAQFIRIRSTAPTANGAHYIALRAFELFGALRIPDFVVLN
jgi:hypothetical protein